MVNQEFKRIARILKESYKELEQEAVKNGTDIFSKEYKQAQDKIRDEILKKMGYSLAEYRSAKDNHITLKKVELDETIKRKIGDFLDTHIPTKKEIISLAHEVAQEYIKPPQVTNQIVKETTTPIKETIIQREEYDPSFLWTEIGYLNDKINKIPEPINLVEFKKELFDEWNVGLKDNANLKQAINIDGMPDFRKMAMGLQAQISALNNGAGVSSIIAGSGISVDHATGAVTISASGGSGTVSSVGSVDGSITITNPTTTPDLSVAKAPKWSTARNLAGNSVDGSANVAFANKFIVQGTTDTGLSAAQFLGALGTGIVKNTTTTGVLSIAVAGDFPTLNQNTTGSAATLTTPRTIGGVSFDGSANITVSTATGGFTISGGNLALGANSLTMTGSLGATGARVTKGWFADLEITSAPTINGSQIAAANLSNGTTGSGAVVLASSPTFTTSITTPSVLATANDSGALGASGTAFADLFLASGGVINWNAGNATLTHSAGLLTSNVSLSLGTSNVLTTGTIELGAASDTTIARVSAGVVSIEGVNIALVNVATLSSLASIGTIGTGVWQGTAVGIAYGGTGGSITASNGGVVYSDASRLQLLAGTVTARKVLLSQSSVAPIWSTETYAAPGTSGNIMTSDGTNWLSSAPASSGTWTYLEKLTFTNSTSTQTSSTFSAHTEWMLLFDINSDAAVNAALMLSLILNGVTTGGNYTGLKMVNNALSQMSDDSSNSFTIVGPGNNVYKQVTGEVFIRGKHNNGIKSIKCGAGVGSGSNDYVAIGGRLLNDSNDLTSISIKSSVNVTGTVELWYRDAK